jgi:hypothetical protein
LIAIGEFWRKQKERHIKIFDKKESKYKSIENKEMNKIEL